MGTLRSDTSPISRGRLSGNATRVAREAVLDTLTNAPSSFGALYGAASRFAKRRLGVHAFAALVDQLADGKLIRRWVFDGMRYTRASGLDCARARRGYVAWLDPRSLEELTVEDLAYDHVGLWLTDRSRAL